jgi:hypothetical protein
VFAWFPVLMCAESVLNRGYSAGGRQRVFMTDTTDRRHPA